MPTRTDDTRPLPTMAELYERSARASREAWRNPGDAAPAPRVRDDAPTDPDASRVRLDVADCARSLDAARARHEAWARNAWRNTGDASERGHR